MKQFLHHFQPGLTESVGAGSSTMISLGGTSVETDQVEVRNTRPMKQAGTFSLLTVTVAANTLSGSATLRTGIGTDGGTAGNCSITFTTTQTGTLTDDSNTDDVAVDDLYSFISSVAAGTGSISWARIGLVWEPDSGSISLLGCNSASSLGINSNGTIYLCVSGSRESGTTEVRTQNIVTAAGTWSNLGVGVATIVQDTIDCLFTSRINGVDGNQSLALDETTVLAFFEDDANTDTLASGDLINIEIVSTNHSGTGSTNFEWTASQITHGSDESLLLVGGGRELVDADSTAYFAAAGQTNSAATEADAEHSIRFDATASHLGALVSQTGGGDMVLALRINNADGNQTVTIDVSALSPDAAVDDSNTDDILATDDIAIRATVPSSPGGNCRLQSTSLRLAPAEAGEPSTFLAAFARGSNIVIGAGNA